MRRRIQKQFFLFFRGRNFFAFFHFFSLFFEVFFFLFVKRERGRSVVTQSKDCSLTTRSNSPLTKQVGQLCPGPIARAAPWMSRMPLVANLAFQSGLSRDLCQTLPKSFYSRSQPPLRGCEQRKLTLSCLLPSQLRPEKVPRGEILQGSPCLSPGLFQRTCCAGCGHPPPPPKKVPPCSANFCVRTPLNSRVLGSSFGLFFFSHQGG